MYNILYNYVCIHQYIVIEVLNTCERLVETRPARLVLEERRREIARNK